MAYYLPSASKTLIDGTGQQIVRGRTLIGGTGYTINKGRTLIGGTGYDIRLIPLRWTRLNDKGSNWTNGSYTITFTENGTKLRAELTGSPTTSGDASRYWIGHWFYTDPGVPVSITVSANAGGTYGECYVWYDRDAQGTHYDVINTSAAFSNQTVTFTSVTGRFGISCSHGNKTVSSRWVEVTKIVINGTQVFPAA